MSKSLTVQQLRDKLDKLIDEGHGPLLVLWGEGVSIESPKVIDREAQYIGPSEWDSRHYALGPKGSGQTVTL